MVTNISFTNAPYKWNDYNSLKGKAKKNLPGVKCAFLFFKYYNTKDLYQARKVSHLIIYNNNFFKL